MVTNREFLTAIFGDSYIYSHVTSFTYDPYEIPENESGRCWAGGYYKDTHLQPNSNQFYTVSLFVPDDSGRSRRRKVSFSATYVIGLDDVKEKLPIEQVKRLPAPSIVLKSSLYSEQWLYILDQPETDRNRIDNLHDGLIENGLAPDSKDPGQKGVTRYLRLPDGYNTKAKRIIENGGTAPQCQITEWHPERRYTLEQLAAPFAVDLNAVRRDARIDGAAAVSDHPIINIPEIIQIKEVRSDGRFDITCPWVREHTGGDDSGSAVFTNSDGSIGFKCHHGTCQSRTGSDLLHYIEGQKAGFTTTLKNWQVMRDFDMPTDPVTAATPNFMLSTGSADALSAAATDRRYTAVAEVSFMDPIPAVKAIEDPSPAATIVPDAIQFLCDQLRREPPTSAEARVMAGKVLKHVDDMPKMDQKHWHDVVCDIMRWSKADCRDILKDLRQTWYADKVKGTDFYDDVLFVKELNQFYDFRSRIFFSTEAFQNAFAHEDAEARKIALQEGRVRKVDKLDYAPKQPQIFIEGRTTYGNTWTNEDQPAGIAGDVARWRDHFDALGWGQYRDHVEKWMAFTLRHPEQKINHMLLFGSGEGCGKDYLLYPLIRGMGENATVICGEELLEGFNDYLLSTKYLHINETELGDRKEAMQVSNKLKPIAAAPPNRVGVNQKGIKRIKIRNIVNGTMTTNSQMPLRLNGVSRRFFGMWSDLNPRDAYDNMTPEWLAYWEDRWNWMEGDGWKNVLYYLQYQVDLKDFNPKQAPPMTQFLRDIVDSSKSPILQTVEAFIKSRVGMFQCDLMTAKDMSDTLRTEDVFGSADLYCDAKVCTPVNIGKAISTSVEIVQLRTPTTRVYALRNPLNYQAMSQPDLQREYERQVAGVRGSTPLTVVK